MELLISDIALNLTYDQAYKMFLHENDIEILDELLEFFISIQNYNACAAMKELFREKCLKN